MGGRGTEVRKRDDKFFVRVDANEKVIIKKKANYSGITPAEYLRRSALTDTALVVAAQTGNGLSEADRLALGKLPACLGRRAGLLKHALSKAVDIRDAELRALLDGDHHLIMETKRSVDDLKRRLGS